MYGYDDAGIPLSDEALLAEIAAYRKAVRDVATRTVGVISGEGRQIVFSSSNVCDARDAIRELLRIARERGLEIGGTASALIVEIG